MLPANTPRSNSASRRSGGWLSSSAIISKVLQEADLEKLNGAWARYKDVDEDGIPYRTIPGNRHPAAKQRALLEPVEFLPQLHDEADDAGSPLRRG